MIKFSDEDIKNYLELLSSIIERREKEQIRKEEKKLFDSLDIPTRRLERAKKKLKEINKNGRDDKSSNDILKMRSYYFDEIYTINNSSLKNPIYFNTLGDNQIKSLAKTLHLDFTFWVSCTYKYVIACVYDSGVYFDLTFANTTPEEFENYILKTYQQNNLEVKKKQKTILFEKISIIEKHILDLFNKHKKEENLLDIFKIYNLFFEYIEIDLRMPFTIEHYPKYLDNIIANLEK